MEDFILFLKNQIYNWLYCIFSPYKSCRNILIEKQITDIEKIQYAFGIWLVAFLLTVSLEIPIFSFFQIEWGSPKFFIPYFVIGFLYLIVTSTFFHLGLLIFRIPSKLSETFLIYSILFGSFSPFILLGMYPLTLKNLYILKIFKEHNYDFIYLYNNFKTISNNFDKIFIISLIFPITNIFSNVLACSLGVLLCLIIIEKYRSSRVKTFICVTISQTAFLILPLLLLKLVEWWIILENLKIK